MRETVKLNMKQAWGGCLGNLITIMDESKTHHDPADSQTDKTKEAPPYNNEPRNKNKDIDLLPTKPSLF